MPLDLALVRGTTGLEEMKDPMSLLDRHPGAGYDVLQAVFLPASLRYYPQEILLKIPSWKKISLTYD